MKKQKWLLGFGMAALAIASAMASRMPSPMPTAQGLNGRQVPMFEPDPTFPQLPNNWVLGYVSKVMVDRHDNVWFIHRPRSVPAGKTSAPPVLEFDASGKFLQAWGGPGDGYDWPQNEHNVFVDYQDNVWISGSAGAGPLATQQSDDMLIKFTNTGKFIKQLGGRSVSKGNKDTNSVNKPGDIFVDARTKELYASDGYGNRRVIVFDADTLSFKRMWAAFGKVPEDAPGSGGPGATGGAIGAPAFAAAEGAGRGAPPVLETEGPGPDSFASPVHGILVSNDNIVYVGDRSNRRVQLFTTDGKYLKELFINRAGPAAVSISGLAFSPDKDQQFLYVADYGNSRILVIDRKTLDVLYQFGKRGTSPGEFRGIHHLAVDSKGNIYAAEVAPGARIQRLVFKGMSSTLPSNALTEGELAAKPQP